MSRHHSPHIVTDGLVLYLDAANQKSFVSGSTIWHDLSGKWNNFTAVSNVGLQNNHMYFAGDADYFTVNDNSKLDGFLQITLESWCYPMRTSPYEYLFSNTRDSGGVYNGFELKIFNGGARLVVWNSTSNVIISTIPIEINKWYHIVGTYDGAIMKIYVNGKLGKESNSLLGIGTPSTANLHIGAMGLYDTHEFQGYIDISKIYNRALTSQEILQNYNALKSRFGL